ncbi:death domain-associated protein 6-like [Ornithodoros turicata]|uniref:death domain-associated protein 6-like n=1 Tax=Ornithodoros turicata TaxID=34597 RepID=UPI003138DB70
MGPWSALMADVMSGIVSVSEIILISDDEESTEKNHKIPTASDTKANIRKESHCVDEEDVKNGKEQSLIVPIKKIDDQELLHRANYQVSPVLVKMTARANEVLKKFLSACQPLMHTANDCKILDSIRHDVQQANLHYLASDKFYDTVKFLAERVTEDPKNVFVYIKELSDELRAYKDKCPKAKKTSVNGEATQSSAPSGEEGKDVNGTLVKQSRSKTATSENETSSGVEHARGAQSDRDSDKKEDAIRRLTRHLEKLARAAKKLEEKEVDWEDPDDVNSPYLMESRIKAKAMKVWLKICELEGRRPKTGRVIEKKLRYGGSRYPEVNKSIEKFVNKKGIFPDYTDVLSIVKSQNEESSLGLRDCQVQSVAEEVFRDVGKLLQERRQKDDFSLAMARLANVETEGELKDPAEGDAELETKLGENFTKAKQRLTEVIDSFVHKQMEMKLEPQEVKEDDCDQSPPPSPKPEKKEGEDDGDDGNEEDDETEDEADEAVIVPKRDDDDDDDDDTDETTEGEDDTQEGDEDNSEVVSQGDTQTEDSRTSLPEKTHASDLKMAVGETEHTESPDEKPTTDKKIHAQESATPQGTSPTVDMDRTHGGVPISKTEYNETKERNEEAATLACTSRGEAQQQKEKQPEKPEPEVIEIPSDDDDIVATPAKKPKLA